MNYNPTRKAVLISSPGPVGSRLPGTSRDLLNMTNFLSSPRGGLWDEKEIVILENPSFEYAKDVIDSRTVDYLLVYFSGHGFSDEGKRYLVFEDTDVEDILLFNNGKKQLVIADSCRSHFGAVGSIPRGEEDWLSFTGDSWAREVFNDSIRESPDGLTLVHATHDGAFAQDMGARYGGAFTFCLLSSTFLFETTKRYSPVRIDQLILPTTELLHIKGCDQFPEIFSAGDLQVAFLIDAEQTEIKKEGFAIEKSDIRHSSVLIGAIVLAGVAALFINNDKF